MVCEDASEGRDEVNGRDWDACALPDCTSLASGSVDKDEMSDKGLSAGATIETRQRIVTAQSSALELGLSNK